MQPVVPTEARAAAPALDANDRVAWAGALLPDCAADAPISPEFTIYAAAGEWAAQGRALVTAYQLLYKAPGSLAARAAPAALSLPGLMSAEIQAEEQGFAALVLVAADFRRLVLRLASRPLAHALLAAVLRAAHLPVSALPAFKAPALQQRWAWAPSEINKDWQRLGLPNQRWRLSVTNSAYRICPAYPAEMFVPAAVSDAQLERAAAYREGGRFACLSLVLHSGAVLARCSQPRAQPNAVCATKCAEDAALMAAMMDAKPWWMLDVRPRVHSLNSADLGMAAAEDPSDYPGMTFHYIGLDSIAAVRHALSKLYAACDDHADGSAWLASLASSRWLRQVSELLNAAKDTLALLLGGTSVVIRSAEGGDEDSQLSSLILLMHDPHYRTASGFRTLVEREWVLAGHKFATRLGLNGKERESGRAPVFLQFLDACYQILKQFPHAFQFRESYLVALADALYSARYGNFLHDSARERASAELERLTPSIWTALSDSIYANELYDQALGVLTNVDHRLSHLSFWQTYHLHRLKDSTLLSVPRKPVVNVFAQWREAQALEAQLTKQLTLMEMRQRERDALPEDKGNTEAEKLRNRIQELQTKLDRAFTAAKQLEKDVANSKETNRKLAEECRVMRAQADPNTTLSGMALDTRVLIGVSATVSASAPALQQAYHKFYLRLLDSVKELLLSSQQLVDDATGAQDSTEATRKYCTNLAHEFVETVEISPHTSAALLQEAKAVRESFLLLVEAAEEEERGNDRGPAHLQVACQLLAANVSACIEAAAAPLKELTAAAQSTLSRLSPQGGRPVQIGPTGDASAKSDEARAAEAVKKVGRLTAILRTRDVVRDVQAKKASAGAGSRRGAIAAAAAQAAANARLVAENERQAQLLLAGVPLDALPPPPPQSAPPLQPLLADAVGEAQGRQGALAALGAVQAPPPHDPAAPETGSRREVYLRAIQAPVPKAGAGAAGRAGEALKSGYLTKRGEGLRTWKRRWFVLRADSLTYYAMVGAPTAKGAIAFEGGVALSPHSAKKAHCFSVITPRRTYYLAAKDEEERNAWYAALAGLLPQTLP